MKCRAFFWRFGDGDALWIVVHLISVPEIEMSREKCCW